MLRPSRPMMRPFMSSAESWTTETVVSAAWPAASRCMTTERMLRTRRSASRLVSSSIWRTTRARSWRTWSSSSLSSAALAWDAGMPATRSSSRTWCSRARWSSSGGLARACARARRAAPAGSRPPPRGHAGAPRGAGDRRGARRSCRPPSRPSCRAAPPRPRAWPPAPLRSPARRCPLGASPGDRRVSSAAAATRPTARTSAAIRISMTFLLPDGPRWKGRGTSSSSLCDERQAGPCSVGTSVKASMQGGPLRATASEGG